MGSKNTVILFLLFQLTGFQVICQDTNSSRNHYLIAGLRYHYGDIIAHTPEIAEAAASNPVGMQLDISWHLNTFSAFRYCNCLPRLGISMHLWDYQNPDILGYSAGLMAFVEPFFNLHHRVNFSIRPGIGLTWLSNPYDSISNPSNLAYSTRIGYSLLLNLNVYYRVSKHLILNTGVNINHISNGGVKQPNKGLNYPSISLGIEYKFHPGNFKRFSPDKSAGGNRQNKLIIAGLLGFKGLLTDNRTYLIPGLYTKYLMHLGKNSYLAGGFEFDDDQTKLAISKLFEGVDADARYILSFLAGYEHTLGRFSITIDLGAYLRNPDQGRDLIFQRYGIKYHFTKHVFMGINLKAHRNNAEFFDFRVGYNIFTKTRSISPNAHHME